MKIFSSALSFTIFLIFVASHVTHFAVLMEDETLLSWKSLKGSWYKNYGDMKELSCGEKLWQWIHWWWRDGSDGWTTPHQLQCSLLPWIKQPYIQPQYWRFLPVIWASRSNREGLGQCTLVPATLSHLDKIKDTSRDISITLFLCVYVSTTNLSW